MASSSDASSSSAAEELSDYEVTALSPPPKTTTAPKSKANRSSKAPKPSSTQVSKPKPLTAAAQVPKSKSDNSKSAAAATQVPKPNPPKPTSSSEEEESSDGNDSDSAGEEKDDKGEEEEEESSDGSYSEPGENRINQPPQQQQPPLKPTTTDASGDGSTDDSGSESFDQPPPSPRRPSRVADPSINPIASKPSELTSNQGPDNKKHKVLESSENHSGVQKRQLFQRIWSEEDEISILHGMAEFHANKGTLPSSTDMNAFYNFVHKSLQIEVSKTQLADKVRRLKKKYDAAAARGKNGVDPFFTKPHERTAYDLSKKIWGPKRVLSKDTEIDGNITRKRQKIKETSDAMITNEDDDSVNVKSPYPLLRKAVLHRTNQQSSSPVTKRALELVDDAKAMALEKKYHKLRLSEMKQYMYRMDLTKEIMKMTISAIEKLG